MIGNQSLRQRAKNGNASAHAGFKSYVHARTIRRGKHLLAMHRQQRLIRGDHVFPFADGFKNDVFGKIIPTH